MIKNLIEQLAIVLCITLSSNTLIGQSVDLYAPLAIPMAISGSFGEIRTDHFHSGVDFRTNGKAGFRVYSSDTGYVSRIKVSSIGFGKTIYIEHPNGITTVYAHLDRFEGKIAQYVENAQYSQKSFEIELFPEKNELNLRKGEIIAISGNSGSSGGPHLHYEVRQTSTQMPISPLKHFKKWGDTDTSAPSITALYLYSIDSIGLLTDSILRTNIKFDKKKTYYWVNDTVYAFGKVGLGVESFDFINEQSNRCGFSKISLSVNEKVAYTLNIDSFAFAETKYVNSVIDYKSKIINGDEIVQLWVDDNNKFSGLSHNNRRGYLLVENDSVYTTTIKVSDQAENTSTLKMVIKGKQPTDRELKTNTISSGILLEYSKDNKLSTEEYEIIIPKDALYHNILFNHKSEFIGNTTQKVYRIHNPKTPVHKKFTLKIKNQNIPQEYFNKTYIGYVNGKGVEYCDSKLLNGYIEAICGKFGNYVLALDTTPPVIKPRNISNKVDLSSDTAIRLSLFDETGISTYSGFIDGQWVLFEWDPKTDSLIYYFDKKRIKQKSWHKLKLEVTDRLNNKSEFACEFFW